MAWAYSVENLCDIYEIALAAAGGATVLRERPSLAFFATFGSPLVHTDEDLANALWAVEHDIPLIYIGGGCAGTTGPITGAGQMVVYLAGALSGLAILQLKKRGAPVCIGGVHQAMDLPTGRPAYGSPETSLCGAAAADISRWLGLPFMGTAGASEAKTLDLQAAIESTVQVLLSAFSGATLVHDVGFLDCAQIGSLEALIMNDEIIGMALRIMRGIEVNDDTLLLDLIDEVGPGGDFMSAEITARRCRKEIWNPAIFDRKPWEIWQAAGARSVHDRIRARLRRILTQHVPAELPEGAAEKITAVLQRAKRREAEIQGS